MGPGLSTSWALGTRRARQSTSLWTAWWYLLQPSAADGSFFISAAPVAAPDAPHVFTASTAIVGSMAGVSVEARADAGNGDMNVTRGFVDRPIVPSGTGGSRGT